MKVETTPESVHTFAALTAREWRLRTRVTLNNKTGEPFVVHAEIWDSKGRLLGDGRDLALVPDLDAAQLDLEILEESVLAHAASAEDRLFHFSLVPLSWSGSPRPVEVDRKEISRLNGAQDHFVEHYDPDSGYSSGVLYQVGPLNDRRAFPSSSLLVQAPKVFVRGEESTWMQFLYDSSDRELRREARIRCFLSAESGEILGSWEERIDAHGFRRVDIREALRGLGLRPEEATNRHGFLHFQAYCRDAAFITHTVNRNEKSGALAVEHTLPPIYYDLQYGGPMRAKAFAFWDSLLAPQVMASPAAVPSLRESR